MNNSTIRSALPGLVLSTIILTPFLNKSFTIDDPVFLLEARHALLDPLHPTAFEMVWQEVPERVSQLVPTGPIMAWLLTPTILANGAEWLAHVTQLFMLWLAIFATVSLARRLDLPKPWATASGLILVATPTVLAMAGTAMPDIPAMALGIAGIERLVAWKQNQRFDQALLAALLLGMAPMARPHLILLLGIGAILLLGKTPSLSAVRERLLLFFPIIAALIVTVIIYFISRDPHPQAGSLVGSAVKFSSVSVPRLASNFVAFPIHWVLAMAFALPWLALRWRTIQRTPFLLIAVVAGALISGSALAYINRFSLPLSIIAGIGLTVLCDVISDALRKRDAEQLALGLWLLIALPILPYAHLPPKYLIASAPAATLLIARELSNHSRTMSSIVAGVTVALGVLLGVAILRADTAFANLGRKAAAELIAPNVAAGTRVWFMGHWGFQWYAEKVGARHLTLTPPYPDPGDIVVVSLASARSDELLNKIGSRYGRMTQIGQLSDSSPGGRIINKRLGASFYTNVGGYLPWAWGDGPIDLYTVWLVQ